MVALVEVIFCPLCQQAEPVVRHGYNRCQTPRYRCKVCRKTFTPTPNPRRLTPQREQAVGAALSERLSISAVARLFGMSRQTVYDILKKTCQSDKTQRVNPTFDALEIDEMCVSHRRNVWLWVASSRYTSYTGQILAFAVGDRSRATLARLWAQVPKPWQHRLVYTDGYKVYQAFFAAWQHRICAKGDGGTNTAAGVNNSLRHRCGSLVRRTSARSRCLGFGTGYSAVCCFV